jgi:YD repeat-containing protein
MKEIDMRLCLALTLFAAACTAANDPTKLPSASLSPHLQNAQDTTVACGDSVAFNGDSSPDLSYAYTYNAAGELSHAEGAWTAGGPDDKVDYAYDANGNMTNMTEADGTTSGSVITETFDATNGLTDYTWSAFAPSYNDSWDYAMSGFIAPWQPTREVMTEAGQPSLGYTLAYDADGRLTTATPDTGAATTYTYDDAAGTISVDTGNGAFTGLITYNASFFELSEVWGGSDPNAWASSTVYAWNGDQLTSATFSEGTQAAPKTLSLAEVDTIQYQCANVKRGGHTRFTRPTAHAH